MPERDLHLPRHPAGLPVFLLLLLFCLAVRVQTFGNPVLEFDEQFYLLVGDRMLHGAHPFIDIFDRKPVGLFLIYAGARALGGTGVLQYQLVAACSAALTAFLLYCAATRLGDRFVAAIIACLYLLWLCFMGCEGGQSPVFYNLPMMAAALLTLRAVEEGDADLPSGAAAMTLVGLAIQIKYTVLPEGLFLGCVFLWVRHRRTRQLAPLVTPALLWASCALLPTAIVAFVYWWLGAFETFAFANFFSIFGRLPDPFADRAMGLIKIAAILLPLAVPAVFGPRPQTPAAIFVWAWLGVALLGFLAFGSFLSPHYGTPLLLPLALAAAPGLARPRRRLAAMVLVFIAFAVVQILIAAGTHQKGGRAQAEMMAAAARPRHGCLYVYDGYPALYLLTGSCLPTRWAFPGHLNSANEASASALGVDPLTEERRILATRPEVIVDEAPSDALGNRGTHALVAAALARDYRLSFSLRTGKRTRLVYRRKDS